MQILTLEVIMKRQVSICIFLSIIVILLALVYIKFSNGIRYGDMEPTQEPDIQMSELEENNKPSVDISQEYITYYFYAIEDDGQVVIYDVQSQTLYMETGIAAIELPAELHEELESGIFFKDEIVLFNFLENYSS